MRCTRRILLIKKMSSCLILILKLFLKMLGVLQDMEASIKRVYQLLIILGLGVLLFVLALTTPVMYNNVDFSMYNPSWNGCSNIAVKTYEQGKLKPTYYFKESELTIGQHSFADYSLEPSSSSIL